MRFQDLFQLIQITFSVERGLAARGGAGDGLAVNVILHIAGGEHTGLAGRGRIAGVAALGDQIARAIHLQLAFEDVGIWLVANGDKDAGEWQVFGAAICGGFKARAGYSTVIA